MEKATKYAGIDAEDVKVQLTREYNGTGPFLFSFDSGTPAAIKQLRHQLILANLGSINLEMDGSRC